ncbi:transcription-repair coupling factor [Desulfolithobacter sp.]
MQSIIGQLPDRKRTDICGLHGGSAALFLARTAAGPGRSVCCIVPSDEQLEPLAQDIRLFTNLPVLVYPSFEIPPYTPLAPDPATVALRLATLYQLQEQTGPVIVLVSIEALQRRILPPSVLNRYAELVMAGEETDRDQLIESLTRAGYQMCAMVQHEGDMAVRGGIVDIYAPPSSPEMSGPVRLDFFGDTIESIRVFDPVSQRSLYELEEAVLLPASDILFPDHEKLEHWRTYLAATARELEWNPDQAATLFESLDNQIRFPGIEFSLPLLYPPPEPIQTFFDYLPADVIMVQYDPAAVQAKLELVWERITTNYDEGRVKGLALLPPRHLFLDQSDLEESLAGRTLVNLCQLPDPDSPVPPLTIPCGDHTLLRQEIDIQRRKRGLLAPLADKLVTWLEREDRIYLACRSPRQAKHLGEMLQGYQIRTGRSDIPLDLTRGTSDQVTLVEHPLSTGFDLVEEKLHILSATELFGEKRLRTGKPGRTRGAEAQPVQVEELDVGDIVVHRDHGLGTFQGLVNMEFAGQRGDFMEIRYRDGDTLYVPVDRLHWVSRYQGLPDQQPRLDRLGSERWQTIKKKVTDAVWKVAQELLEIYARRAIRKGHRFSPPGELYRELEESFPYDETPGQKKAIEEVLDDLTSDQPMDRLVCGDVGYGKTEVAVRAAFKVIEDGYQVAVLVPTTVLAEQHAATFRDRFAGFPVEVACLNRFRSSAEQKKIVAGLADGTVDLVVGTHRLLSKDIVFNRLGLLIVDEEHRFGVTHKEKIKKMRAEVDILTLTATPIPRTLQMSLLGIRDLSVISTPPRRRRAVKTFLARHDQLVIREAVLRELQRGGQLFFVHNRVRTIERVAENVNELVPQARVAVAHGQMPGSQLEEIMVRFINHEIDILVCTTIIESGLDIPNAGTIIINRADHLGLADIYQLRGRVGRSSRQSYAYLLVPSLDALTADAKKRLRALMDCSELGGGFKLAMNDLQIRGGGNLLGVSQSGHIAAVGYDLYLELLQSTVAELKKKTEQGEDAEQAAIDPEINLRLAAFLPESYIADTAQRYHIYRRISAAGSQGPNELADLREELEDRYGNLPGEAATLLQIIGLKHQLREFGIQKLEQGPKALVFSFVDNAPVDPRSILELIDSTAREKTPIRLTPDQRLVVPIDESTDIFLKIRDILSRLKKR